MVGFGALVASVVAAICLLAPAGAVAQGGEELGPGAEAKPAILLLFDSSKSMRKPTGEGGTRIEAAREAVRRLVDDLPDDAPIGLRLYGSEVSGTGRREGCRDTSLVAPVRPGGGPEVVQAIEAAQPTGFTPIGRSLREAAGDFPQDAGRQTVVLVSDGGDNCAPPDPCEVAEEVGEQGIELTIQVVGLQVSERVREELACIADAGGGTYRDAEDAEELARELNAIFVRELRRYAVAGRAVEGGTDPSRAPVLGPGQYVTRLGADEPRWYGIPAGLGQFITAGATFPPTAARASDGQITVPGPEFLATLHEPGVQADDLGFDSNGLGGFGTRLRLSNFGSAVDLTSAGLLAGPVGQAENMRDAGVYLLELELVSGGNAGVTGAAFPLELRLDTLGRPRGPVPRPGATRSPPAARPPARAASEGGDGDGGLVWAAAIGLGLVCAPAGWLVTRRLRARDR